MLHRIPEEAQSASRALWSLLSTRMDGTAFAIVQVRTKYHGLEAGLSRVLVDVVQPRLAQSWTLGTSGGQRKRQETSRGNSQYVESSILD